jgi:6-phosphofructokinase 1
LIWGEEFILSQKLESQKMKTLGVFTSGGDAPGMNAAIRAVTRSASQQGLEVIGIMGGYQGLLNEDFQILQPRGMANILQRGGTILKTGRCLDFHKPEIRKKAADIIRKNSLHGLVCIGGDGSFAGAHALWVEHQISMLGLPATIDNDVWGTDVTIGFDTAVNTALSAIDKIRDTADSHDRLFIVEVMGRNTGFIAAHVGLAGGAEDVMAPEYLVPFDHVIKRVQQAQDRGKKSSIIVTAEGEKPGRAYDLAEQFRKRAGLDAKVAILGHQQRGGSPTANDRILASRMGASVVELLLQGHCDKMVGVQNGQLILVPFEQATRREKKTSQEYLKLVNFLAV